MTGKERELLIATARAVNEMARWGQNMGCSPQTVENLRKAIGAFALQAVDDFAGDERAGDRRAIAEMKI